MLTRYWQWTSGPAPSAASGLPFGPLRFRAWTSASGAAAGETSLPFGPLRFRAWTNGIAITPTPPVIDDGGSAPFYRLPLPNHLRRFQLEDEEILLFVAAWITAEGNK